MRTRAALVVVIEAIGFRATVVVLLRINCVAIEDWEYGDRASDFATGITFRVKPWEDLIQSQSTHAYYAGVAVDSAVSESIESVKFVRERT